MKKTSFIVGIDEVGRGPIAGPVSVCAVKVPADFPIHTVFPSVGDSKKTSEKKREAVYAEALKRAHSGEIVYAVMHESSEVIDTEGIEEAIKRALTRALMEVAPDPSEVFVYLDGRLYAPDPYQQETVIGGDASVPAISLASIIAKVSRDRLMVEASRTHPQYGFERHKGYGTEAHIACIRDHGVCPMHRTSFLSKINAKISA